MGADLADLINEYQGDRTLQQLSRDCGGVPKAARLHQLLREPQKMFPGPDTLRGLARGLGVPIRVVVHAAACSVGLEIEESSSRLANLLPVDADRIPERSQDALMSVVRAMLAREYDGEAYPLRDRATGSGAAGESPVDVMRAAYRQGREDGERAVEEQDTRRHGT